VYPLLPIADTEPRQRGCRAADSAPRLAPRRPLGNNARPARSAPGLGDATTAS